MKKAYTHDKEFSDEKIIQQYQKIYQLNYIEAKLFIELEGLISEDKVLEVGFLNKFVTNSIKVVKNNPNYNIAIRNGCIIALDLSRWEINELPRSLIFLSKIKYLNLGGLELESLPELIGSLSRLKELNLSGNNLIKVPESVILLVKRKIARKYIWNGVIPSEALVLGLLEVLKGNKLEKVAITTSVIDWMYALNYKIDKNGSILGIYICDEKNDKKGITIFPEQICTLKFLEELEISQEAIKNIPECIGNLLSLKYLNLYFNKINSIPESINKLKNLEHLNLEDNEMPESMLMSLRWNMYGQDYIDKCEYDKAVDECKETLRIYPKNEAAWYHLGIACKEKGELDDAIDAFYNIIKIDPKTPAVLSILGDIYTEKGESDKAIEVIKSALEIDPKIAVLWSNLGFNYKKSGKYNKAIEAYKQSLVISPINKFIWNDLSLIYQKKGEYDKANIMYDLALDIEINLEDVEKLREAILKL
ncbi:MAG: tetratricopeptide repeat protein [Promethearchaeota archaeon]